MTLLRPRQCTMHNATSTWLICRNSWEGSLLVFYHCHYLPAWLQLFLFLLLNNSYRRRCNFSVAGFFARNYGLLSLVYSASFTATAGLETLSWTSSNIIRQKLHTAMNVIQSFSLHFTSNLYMWTVIVLSHSKNYSVLQLDPTNISFVVLHLIVTWTIKISTVISITLLQWLHNKLFCNDQWSVVI